MSSSFDPHQSPSPLYPAQDRRFTPWKNGGGQTAEVLCVPTGSDLESFDWRISTARVGQSGPFSRFVGIDRVLTILEGGAIRLQFASGLVVDLAQSSAPLSFSGEDACEAELLGEALLDLNLMVRRPLEGAILRSGEEVDPQGLLACYLFALADLAEPALGRFDLLELPLIAQTVPDRALILTVRRSAA
ncbi:HutD family protein [Arenibacterium sp. LLYu02]|uniref:HutD/Ves family protein n=1 Tax=Arenibacterium sp. LLYu02 TaxID=3404132 RepID=UPI003B21CACD